MDEREKKHVNLYAMSTNKWNAYCICGGEGREGGSAMNTHGISAIKIL